VNSYKVPCSDKGAVGTAVRRASTCSWSCSVFNGMAQCPSVVRTPCVRAMAVRTPCARGGFLSVQLYAKGTMAVRS